MEAYNSFKAIPVFTSLQNESFDKTKLMCFSGCCIYKYGGLGWVGTLSDSATLLRHNNTKSLPTPVMYLKVETVCSPKMMTPICLNSTWLCFPKDSNLQEDEVF